MYTITTTKLLLLFLISYQFEIFFTFIIRVTLRGVVITHLILEWGAMIE